MNNITAEGALSVNARWTRSSKLAAIARVLSRVLPETVFKDETLKIVVMFSGVGLVLVAYGLDFGAFSALHRHETNLGTS